MATVDKVKIGSTTYDVAPSGAGTLNTDSTHGTVFTSNDAASPSSWSSTEVISTTDNQALIFSKLTTMVKNIRYINNKFGTTDFSIIGSNNITGALNLLQTNKAATSHSHTTAALPISNTQIDSSSYIPTSSLVYSMNTKLQSLYNIKTIYGEEDIGEGVALPTGTMYIVYSDKPPEPIEPPNERYESKFIGAWSSVSDVDTFLNTYNTENGYSGLKLGNYVTIQDGTYNVDWEIAGFDMEHNQTAADGTVYDNGYGICLIPKRYVTTAKWNTTGTLTGGYKSSNMHTNVLPTIANNLKNILGDHLVLRNVLLSNKIDSNYTSSSYTWTTAYATLMSVGQMTGTFASNRNKYDDGEANYKLPLFDYEDYNINEYYWLRGVYGFFIGSGSAYCVYNSGVINMDTVTDDYYGVRPLIYLC